MIPLKSLVQQNIKDNITMSTGPEKAEEELLMNDATDQAPKRPLVTRRSRHPRKRMMELMSQVRFNEITNAWEKKQ